MSAETVHQIDEDFRAALKKGSVLPDGWKSDSGAIAVRPDEKDRPCLTVTQKGGRQLVTLPPVTLAGSFFVEAEAQLIVGRPFSANVLSQMVVHLQGRNGAAPVFVCVDINGISISGSLPPEEIRITNKKTGPGYESLRMISRFRIVVHEKTLQVFVNDTLAAASTLEKIGEYDMVRIGLTPPTNYLPRFYSVKVGNLAATQKQPIGVAK